MDVFIVEESENPKKKFTAIRLNPSLKKISFGSKGMDDFTTHKDVERKRLYLLRHKANENWEKSGIMTAGFWSRWLLWNKPSLRESADDMEKRFNIKIAFAF